MPQENGLPTHVAIILDGNRRWAKKKNLPPIMGHKAGIDSIREAINSCIEMRIPMLTIYAFSTENWTRPKEEVSALMGFIEEYVDRELKKMESNGIRLNCLGRIDRLPQSVRDKLRKAMESTKKNSRLVFNAAINYGARSEIVDAVKNIIKEDRRDINEDNFGDFLYTKGLADPDLVIRTSGEKRLSNFLLWQASYSELYFTDVLWPDFRKKDLEQAVATYMKRQRRFGE